MMDKRDKPFRIGIVGHTGSDFDSEAVQHLLEIKIPFLLHTHQVAPAEVEIVSGLVDTGVPKLVHEVATRFGLRTVGIASNQALQAEPGLLMVDEQIFSGESFGEESQAFIDHIDFLFRIGGGMLGANLVEMFKEKLNHDIFDVLDFILEYDVD